MSKSLTLNNMRDYDEAKTTTAVPGTYRTGDVVELIRFHKLPWYRRLWNRFRGVKPIEYSGEHDAEFEVIKATSNSITVRGVGEE